MPVEPHNRLDMAVQQLETAVGLLPARPTRSWGRRCVLSPTMERFILDRAENDGADDMS
jgi:hypothetical protein